MALENLTVMELHVHTGEESEDEPIIRRVTESDDESTDSGRRGLFIALGLTLVSVAVSVGVTLAVRRFRSWRAGRTEEPEMESVVEIEQEV